MAMPTKNPKRPRRTNGPSLRLQWLGKQLRDLRIDARVTLEDAGDFIQRDGTTVGRMEKATTAIRKGDVVLLLDLYRVSDETTRMGLIQLSDDAWRKGWWDGYGKYASDRLFVDYPWLESRAERICEYEVFLVPGLLQTPEYATALMRHEVGESRSDEIARWLEFRIERQGILDASDSTPPEVEIILCEQALRMTIGGPEVMRAQLDHLVKRAADPRISIRVIPLITRERAGMSGPFTIFEMPDPYPDVAYTENLAGQTFVEESDDVDKFVEAYTDLQEFALSEADSRKLISTIAKEL